MLIGYLKMKKENIKKRRLKKLVVFLSICLGSCCSNYICFDMLNTKHPESFDAYQYQFDIQTIFVTYKILLYLGVYVTGYLIGRKYLDKCIRYINSIFMIFDFSII